MQLRSIRSGSTSQIALGCLLLLCMGSGCERAGSWWGAWHHGGGKPSHPGSGGTAGSGAAPSGRDPTLPVAQSECPKLETGTVEFLGVPVRLWVGERRDDVKGSVVFYWHGTGSSPAEAESMLSEQIPELLEDGGVLVALAATTEEGDNTSTATWYTGDYAIADEVLACAVKQRNIDPRRVYTTGCSSGGVHAAVMAYQRSGYIAAATPNSGGIIQDYTLQNRDYAPAVMTAHGSSELDVVIVDFAQVSLDFVEDIAAQGGFAVDCNHGTGHCQAPPALKAAQWQFLKDHPYGVSPEPYAAGLPAAVPDYCEVIE